MLYLGEEKVIMEIMLPQLDDRIQGQFPVQTGNPFIYDAVVQCLLLWAQNYYDAPGLPASLRKLEQFKPIPFGATFRVTMDVEAHSPSFIVGTMTVQDAQGQVYVRIDGLEGTISSQLKRFIGKRE